MSQNNLLDRLQCYRDTMDVLILKLNYLQQAKAECCSGSFSSSSSSSSSSTSSSSSSSSQSSSSSSSSGPTICCEDVDQLSIQFTYMGMPMSARGYIGPNPATFIKIGDIPGYDSEDYCIYEGQQVNLNNEFDRVYFIIPRQDFASDPCVFLYHVDGGAPDQYASLTLALVSVCGTIGRTHVNENTGEPNRVDTFTVMEGSGSWSSSSSSSGSGSSSSESSSSSSSSSSSGDVCACKQNEFYINFPTNTAFDNSFLSFELTTPPPSLAGSYDPIGDFCFYKSSDVIDWDGPDYGDVWFVFPKISGYSAEVFGYEDMGMTGSRTDFFASTEFIPNCANVFDTWTGDDVGFGITTITVAENAPSSSSSSSSSSSESSSSSSSSSGENSSSSSSSSSSSDDPLAFAFYNEAAMSFTLTGIVGKSDIFDFTDEAAMSFTLTGSLV